MPDAGMPSQCDAALPVVIEAMPAEPPDMTSGCANASNANAVHASNASIDRLRKRRERGLSQ
jgi:hypothetical protein